MITAPKNNNQHNNKNKGTEGFMRDLKRANELENKLAQYFEKTYPCKAITTQDKGQFTDYDLVIEFTTNQPSITLEVKEDRVVERTGNVAVEFARRVHSQVVDSCISVSKSDVYAYFFKGRFHLIPTATLKQLIKLKSTAKRWGGDGGRAWIAIIKEKVFMKYVITSIEI